MGYCRMVFPGGNTSEGFHSFYEYIVRADATRIYVIKGGPGVGKSTFMKKLGQEFIEEGYNVEYHWCSSDNDSLDALVLPDYEIALIDGTAPHVLDPRNPGAVDEIINLGEYWNEARLASSRQSILSANQLVGKYFKLAYLRLKSAYATWNEWAEYYGDAVPSAVRRWLTRSIKQEIGDAGNHCASGNTWTRHLFASAITPGGIITYANTLLEDCTTALAVRGAPGTGVQLVLESILTWAEEEGFPVEAYHNPLIPSHLDMLIFRCSGKAVIDCSSTVIDYDTIIEKMPNVKFFDLNQMADGTKLMRFTEDIEDVQERFNTALQGAVGYIDLAKRTHDLMETYYVPAMNFNLIDSKRQEIKERILGYIKGSN
ncbi:MAG: hypothetical protein ACM3PP_03340 [Candidatus Saccharibacteria bacterium]